MFLQVDSSDGTQFALFTDNCDEATNFEIKHATKLTVTSLPPQFRGDIAPIQVDASDYIDLLFVVGNQRMLPVASICAIVDETRQFSSYFDAVFYACSGTSSLHLSVRLPDVMDPTCEALTLNFRLPDSSSSCVEPSNFSASMQTTAAVSTPKVSDIISLSSVLPSSTAIYPASNASPSSFYLQIANIGSGGAASAVVNGQYLVLAQDGVTINDIVTFNADQDYAFVFSIATDGYLTTLGTLSGPQPEYANLPAVSTERSLLFDSYPPPDGNVQSICEFMEDGTISCANQSNSKFFHCGRIEATLRAYIINVGTYTPKGRIKNTIKVMYTSPDDCVPFTLTSTLPSVRVYRQKRSS